MKSLRHFKIAIMTKISTHNFLPAYDDLRPNFNPETALTPPRAHPQRNDAVNTHKRFGRLLHCHLLKPNIISSEKASSVVLKLQENSMTIYRFELNFQVINSLSPQLDFECMDLQECIEKFKLSDRESLL